MGSSQSTEEVTATNDDIVQEITSGNEELNTSLKNNNLRITENNSKITESNVGIRENNVEINGLSNKLDINDRLIRDNLDQILTNNNNILQNTSKLDQNRRIGQDNLQLNNSISNKFVELNRKIDNLTDESIIKDQKIRDLLQEINGLKKGRVNQVVIKPTPVFIPCPQEFLSNKGQTFYNDLYKKN